MTERAVADRLASLYDGRWLQGYVRWKVRTDPVYAAAAEPLLGRTNPLLDLGCGIGILPFYLRELGYGAPILGIDFDRRKIDLARVAAQRYRGIDFIAGDAREPLPDGHDVVLLDVLHYFDTPSQQRILGNVVRAVPPGGIVVMRQGIRDGSWRHRLTSAVDTLARGVRWMRADVARLNYPAREEIEHAFADFDADVRPLWGRTPYNNYFFLFRRREAARHPE